MNSNDRVEAASGKESLDGNQFLTFNLGEEVYAMDIRTVREIIQHASMTMVPLVPKFVRGVINLRGAVVPVIDLQSRLGRDCTGFNKKTCVIIFDASTEDEKQILGILVDSVSEVIDISNHSIEPTPTFGTPIPREYLHGLGKVGERFIPILNTHHALSLDELTAEIERSIPKTKPALSE